MVLTAVGHCGLRWRDDPGGQDDLRLFPGMRDAWCRHSWAL